MNIGFEIRKLGVIFEDLRDNMQLIAESVSGIQKQLIALRDMVAKNTVDIEAIKMDVESIKHLLRQKADVVDLSTLERRVSLLEKRR